MYLQNEFQNRHGKNINHLVLNLIRVVILVIMVITLLYQWVY